MCIPDIFVQGHSRSSILTASESWDTIDFLLVIANCCNIDGHKGRESSVLIVRVSHATPI